MHLQGRAGLSLRESVLRGRRPLSEPDTKINGKSYARVWAAGLLSSAESRRLRAASPAASVHPSHPHSAHGRNTPHPSP